MLSKNIIDSFIIAKKENKISHLYLFSGLSKFTIDKDILLFLSIILNIDFDLTKDLEQVKQQDILVLDGDKNELAKSEIEKAFFEVSLKTNYENNVATKKVIILKNIEKASVNALNSILKIIEEPVDDLIIIVSTTKEHKVLSTILSRSQKIYSNKENWNEINGKLVSEGNLDPFTIIASFISDDIYQAKSYLNDNLIALFDELLAAFVEVIKRKNIHYLYAFLLKEITKETADKNIFLLNSIKLILRANILFSDLKIKNKYIKQTKQISSELLIQYPKIFEFILDIDNFFRNIDLNANFIIQKELLLLNLLEKYE